MSTSDELLLKIYEEIKAIKNEISEIKMMLIPEDVGLEDEIEEIEMGIKEIKEGKYREWKEIREELK